MDKKGSIRQSFVFFPAQAREIRRVENTVK